MTQAKNNIRNTNTISDTHSQIVHSGESFNHSDHMRGSVRSPKLLVYEIDLSAQVFVQTFQFLNTNYPSKLSALCEIQCYQKCVEMLVIDADG